MIKEFLFIKDYLLFMLCLDDRSLHVCLYCILKNQIWGYIQGRVAIGTWSRSWSRVIIQPRADKQKASPDILGRLYQWGSDVNFNGAGDENRTRTGCPTRPSNVRVYHFHHPGTRDLEIIRSISSFVKSLFEKNGPHLRAAFVQYPKADKTPMWDKA